ncbi:MAG: type IX secretion system membrane protein PorP/SprF [Haliscomenobacteraceae bacterium CHB4]|nr:type IX secretion system membrane protein PorP/SprF [Haliscomenobacteraceae bacterium CHB4]
MSNVQQVPKNFLNNPNMHVRKLLFLLAALLGLNGLSAQDIHFTQFYMSPMTMNPAMSGKFEGTVRIGGIYRGQWASVVGGGDSYKTPSVWADAPIIRGIRKQDWIGVGLVFFTDKAGEIGLQHSATKLGATYHLALGKKNTTVLSIGGQYGKGSRKLGDDRRYEDGYDPSGQYVPSNSKEGNVVDDASYTDIDGGINISSKLNKRMDFNLGFAMYHINQGKYSLAGISDPNGPTPTQPTAGNAKIPRRSILHGQFNAALDDRWSMSPAFQYMTMSGADEIQLQALMGYLFNPEKDITLNFGLGYRLRDAVQAIAGVKYKDLRVGFAYDINTSDLNAASNYRGGFELAANYIVKIYKPATIKQKVLCPRF